MYLIMKCSPLMDAYECDADREPMTITDDWKKWYENNLIDYDFEVYEYDEESKEFNLIKEYDAPMREGMALYYWENDEDTVTCPPIIIKEFSNRTRDDEVPQIVYDTINRDGAWGYYGHEGPNDDLITSGHINWYDKNHRYYVYGEYTDNHYSLGY